MEKIIYFLKDMRPVRLPEDQGGGNRRQQGAGAVD